MMGWRCPCCAGEAPGLRRRGLLTAALGLATAAALPPAAMAQLITGGAPRRLAIQRMVTNESFDGIYWQDGRYDRDALNQLNWVLRDPSRDEATPMDPRLFDVLFTMAQRLDATEGYQVISGYRAPETNAANAQRSRRVSRQSLHMSGMAADVRLPGRDSYALARQAAELQIGGVGLYRRDGFVHLDCGPARRW
ncbi:DUF882 domain-containing protein [Siccirubricoccus sp. KC 17139]|uniref:Murein endopeptidase K n=1 Tax=Siccirubricoccus soli TaxID=2899147 RepID=A0ABT1D620_9PROT|nr:DUF882 domain-containing protein [Siccirubricoccus soli]MCO6416725.1 DUF882 domain-containing protein [Siccirubricoccus soli]MCP2682860.1 DUF882 domain-containing protein [Siccirubricoccus soli]